MPDSPSLNHYQSTLLTCLNQYQPFDSAEAAHRLSIIQFLKQTQYPFSRSTQHGHITSSAVLVNADSSAALLVWHRKLKRWLQPGGHCEPASDTSTHATALRELLEETGLSTPAVALVDTTPFDVDVHLIPATRTEPAHYHYDVRYLFRLTGEQVEIDGARWVALPILAESVDDSIARFGKKLLSGQQH